MAKKWQDGCGYVLKWHDAESKLLFSHNNQRDWNLLIERFDQITERLRQLDQNQLELATRVSALENLQQKRGRKK